MNVFDWSKPTGLLIGRFQPWHSSHRALVERFLADGNPEWKHQKHNAQQVCIMVQVQEFSADAPFSFEETKEVIESDLNTHGLEGRFVVLPAPNISDIFYGRTQAHDVHRIHLPEDLEPLDTHTTRAERAAFEQHFWKNRG